jgi:hypothetical protein
VVSHRKRRIKVRAEYVVEVTIKDESAITRATENEDQFRETYYALISEEEVLEHFAYNRAMNRCYDASTLDGWADLPLGAVTMAIVGEDAEMEALPPEGGGS